VNTKNRSCLNAHKLTIEIARRDFAYVGFDR